MKNIKFIFATLASFAPIFAAVPAVFVVAVKVADAAYIRLESFETETAVAAEHSTVAVNSNNLIRVARMIRLESLDQDVAPVLVYGHSDFSNAFSPRVARAANITGVTTPARTASAPASMVRLTDEAPSQIAAPKPAQVFQASILAALNENIKSEPAENETVEIISVSAPVREIAEVDFNISNFSWGAIDGPEDYNIAFEYSSASNGAYNMAVFYFNQMPPEQFPYNAREAVKQTNKTSYAVVGIDYLNCYSNDAETHKALLLSADSSCATEPTELDNSSMLPDESSNTIILPVQVVYNSGLDRDINETDYITIGLYSVDADGNVIATRRDTNKYFFSE